MLAGVPGSDKSQRSSNGESSLQPVVAAVGQGAGGVARVLARCRRCAFRGHAAFAVTCRWARRWLAAATVLSGRRNFERYGRSTSTKDRSRRRFTGSSTVGSASGVNGSRGTSRIEPQPSSVAGPVSSSASCRCRCTAIDCVLAGSTKAPFWRRAWHERSIFRSETISSDTGRPARKWAGRGKSAGGTSLVLFVGVVISSQVPCCSSTTSLRPARRSCQRRPRWCAAVRRAWWCSPWPERASTSGRWRGERSLPERTLVPTHRLPGWPRV